MEYIYDNLRYVLGDVTGMFLKSLTIPLVGPLHHEKLHTGLYLFYWCVVQSATFKYSWTSNEDDCLRIFLIHSRDEFPVLDHAQNDFG